MSNKGLIDLDVSIQGSVSVDWGKALELCKEIDNEGNYEDDRAPIAGSAAIRLLSVYALMVKHCLSQPKETKLAVVVWPPNVWVVPSIDGLDGCFVEPYSEEKYGSSYCKITKDFNLHEFSSINAIWDGRDFYAEILSAGRQHERL